MSRKFFSAYLNAYRGLSPQVWILALAMLINRAGGMVLFFLTLYLTADLGYDVRTAGFLVSGYGLGSIGGAFLGGWLSDRLGAPRVMIFSLVVSAGGYVWLAYLTQPMAIAIALFFLAIIAEGFRPANSSALAQITEPARLGQAFALNRLAINLGVSIGPALGGFLAVRDYHLLFWVDGLTCLAAALFLYLFFHPEKAALPTSTGADTPGRSPFRDGELWFILLLTFMNGLMFNQLFNTWPLYLKDIFRLEEDYIGLLLTVNGLIIVLTEMPLVHAMRTRSPFMIIFWGEILLFAGFAILPLNTVTWYAFFSVAIWTVGEMLVFPMLPTVISGRASAGNRGTYMGLFSFSFALAFAIGPILGPWIYARNPHEVWFWAAAGALICPPGFAYLSYRHRLARSS
ncbi:MAG: MFS transporter [Calditrichaeota bacterium]|nr:MFS transporter [Calditrichota bacterium]